MEKRPNSMKSISFLDPTEDSYHPAPKPISDAEAKQQHDAQEEFESKRGSHICSLVFGLVFIIAGCVLLWTGSDLNLKDLTILGSILLIFGLVLAIVSIVLLFRGYRRVRTANTKIFDREFVPKKPPTTRQDSFVTQSDISFRGLSPTLSQQSQPSNKELYSDEAIKSKDISKFETALKEHKKEREQSLSRTVIQLGDKSESPTEDVVIIHDAKIALPNPVYNDKNTSNNANTSGAVVFTLETTSANLIHLPGTPDLSTEEQESIPEAFEYIDPRSNSTDL